MSKLIQIRQRIKAIKTIKKITHAMQLISKSTHSNFRNKSKNITTYLHTIESLLLKVKQTVPSWKHFLYQDNTKIKSKHLIILIGSQKGLCGSFNTNLFQKLSNHIKNMNTETIDFISVGQRATSYIQKKNNLNLILFFNNFNASKISSLTNEISKVIVHNHKKYSSITFINTVTKSFFKQSTNITVFAPLKKHNSDTLQTKNNEAYHWEQDPHQFLNDLANNYIYTKIYYILFQSFLTEQASRFISMDNATRNAKKLLKEMKLQYNKLRQEKITKELTELSSSF